MKYAVDVIMELNTKDETTLTKYLRTITCSDKLKRCNAKPFESSISELMRVLLSQGEGCLQGKQNHVRLHSECSLLTLLLICDRA